MRAAHLLLALAAAVLPAPALADVTARYDAGGGHRVTVEVADNGDSRLQIDARMSLGIIHHDGVDYVVLRDGKGVDRVTRGDAILPLILGSPPDQLGENPITFLSTKGGSETLGGYSGTLWSFGPRGEPPLDYLNSPDPRLAPIGKVFRGLAEILAGALGPVVLDPEQLRRVFAGGTPIRMTAKKADGSYDLMITLQSVSMDRTDPARFALPGPEMSAQDFVALVMRPDPNPASGVHY
jgi:hypothetical protein